MLGHVGDTGHDGVHEDVYLVDNDLHGEVEGLVLRLLLQLVLEFGANFEDLVVVLVGQGEDVCHQSQDLGDVLLEQLVGMDEFVVEKGNRLAEIPEEAEEIFNRSLCYN